MIRMILAMVTVICDGAVSSSPCLPCLRRDGVVAVATVIGMQSVALARGSGMRFGYKAAPRPGRHACHKSSILVTWAVAVAVAFVMRELSLPHECSMMMTVTVKVALVVRELILRHEWIIFA